MSIVWVFPKSGRGDIMGEVIKHIVTPQLLAEKFGYIGKPALSGSIGRKSNALLRYLNQWHQNGQVFVYAASLANEMFTHQTDHPFDVHNFYPITWAPERADSSDRQLNGILFPWKITDNEAGNEWSVKWAQSAGSLSTLKSGVIDGADIGTLNFQPYYYTIGGTYSRDRQKSFFIELQNGFDYTPDASGGPVWGQLQANNIEVMSLGIWAGPHPTLDEDDVDVLDSDISPGRPVRGYNSLTRGSIGTVIHAIGEGHTGGETYDTVAACTRKCLFGWGHPIGVYSDDSSFKHLFEDTSNNPATYIVSPTNLTSKTSGITTSYPVVVVSGVNLDGTDKGYIKFESVSAADTVIISVTSDAVQMIKGTALDLLYSGDKIKISMMVDSPVTKSQELYLHTATLWEELYWTD
jgi:hypothetical protein